ncbi:MAG: hypothetical protein ACT4PV_06550 [Planctomycetaceae bacterium]
MRGAGALLVCLLAAGCGEPRLGPSVAVPGRAGAVKTSAADRAERRAYDGAPPVIPHENFGMGCVNCHSKEGLHLPDIGFAPPMPHEVTPGLSALSRCTQCHVFRETRELFRENGFLGLRQDLRRGRRLHLLAPPVMPHPLFMRENCSACHDGPAAREEVRCSHPERARCQQCHVAETATDEFVR